MHIFKIVSTTVLTLQAKKYPNYTPKYPKYPKYPNKVHPEFGGNSAPQSFVGFIKTPF